MTIFRQDLYDELAAYIESRPKINTHCHQLPARNIRDSTLKPCFATLTLTGAACPGTVRTHSRENLLEKVRFNSFFVWLQKSLQQLYGIDQPLSAATWQAWSDRIQAAYKNPSHPRDILTGHCVYRRMLLDAYWDPGSDNGLPDLYAPTFRVNSFFFGYSLLAADHDGNNPYVLYPRSFIPDLDEYVGWVRKSCLPTKPWAVLR